MRGMKELTCSAREKNRPRSEQAAVLAEEGCGARGLDRREDGGVVRATDLVAQVEDVARCCSFFGQ